jgi:hypothetical protein
LLSLKLVDEIPAAARDEMGRAPARERLIEKQAAIGQTNQVVAAAG